MIKKIVLLIAYFIITNCFGQYTIITNFTSNESHTGSGITTDQNLISVAGTLYGMRSYGGFYNDGIIFKIMPDGTGFSRLFDFNNSIHENGSNPKGSLIFDGTFLYGMTTNGGINNLGTIFKIMPDGTGFVKLFDFAGITNGSNPLGSLISDGTFLYGMTSNGGINNLGTIFKIMPNGTGYLKLLDFDGTTNGSNPKSTLNFDGIFLYGTTFNGGTYNGGTIFKIMPNGTSFLKLFDFNGSTNITGNYPYGSLIIDGTFLYGTTHDGGNPGYGVIFKIMTNGTGFSKIFDFGVGSGGKPIGSLVYDGTFLYGINQEGGISNGGKIFKIKPDGTGFVNLLDFTDTTGKVPLGSLIFNGTYLYGITGTRGGIEGNGSIYKIAPDGTGFSKLHDFTESINGKSPFGDLFFDGTFLYGMTGHAGASGGVSNYGTIFKVKPDSTGFTKLLDFEGASNGRFPNGSLISDGNFLYGMTTSGGINNLGTIFKILPDGTGYSKLLDFVGTTSGSYPWGSLIFDGAFLYGMTKGGGTINEGTIFKIKPDGTGYSKLLDFEGSTNGRYPLGSLLYDGTYLYGMANSGGLYNYGTVFKIKPDGTGFSKLLDFDNFTTGNSPSGSLISDGTFLYGMTAAGATMNGGTIFKILPDGTGYSQLLDFRGATNVFAPYGSLIYDGTFLYGMTYNGGNSNNGSIFKIMPDGTGFTKLYDLTCITNGCYPYGSLIKDGTFLYGMTTSGGPATPATGSLGTVFKFDLDTTLSVNVLTKNDLITIYPNPTQGTFTISFNEKEYELTISNFLGQIIQSSFLINTNNAEIDLSSQPNGLYFVQLKTKDGTIVKKVILNK